MAEEKKRTTTTTTEVVRKHQSFPWGIGDDGGGDGGCGASSCLLLSPF
jgi:hypothetical protein